MFSRKTATNILVAFVFLCFSLFSCSQKKTERITFTDGWTWTSPYLKNTDFVPISSDTLYNLSSLLPEKKGYLWINNSFIIPEHLKNKNLGIYIGKVEIVCSILINDKEIGKCGIFPPREYTAGTGSSYFSIPAEYLNQNEINIITIKIWCNGSGNIKGLPFISTFDDAYTTARKNSFINSGINLTFAGAIILVAFLYFFIFIRQPSEKEYLYYSLMCLLSSAYLFPFYMSEFPWLFGKISLLLFKKLFQGISAFVDIYLAMSFIRFFLKHKDSIYIKAVRITLLLASIINTIFIPDLKTFSILLPILFVYSFFQLCFAIWAVIKAIIDKRKEVVLLLMGFSPALICVFVDFFVHVVFAIHTMPFFTVFGWQATIFAFLIILAERYSQARLKAEFLSEKLETEVTQRTNALAAANKRLENENTQTIREINLAAHVQRSFYPQGASVKNGWEISVYFKPFAGISGDLYDFYVFDEKLSGIGLFDVSGHGIAAGLVTMLAKNIIYNTYKDNITAPLGSVMQKINDAVINAKGSIENYLTGAMIRMNDIAGQEGIVELVNAGNPPPLLHKADADTSILLFPKRSKFQHGMIGIPDFDVNFQSVEFGMNENDTLLLYTDGITEAQNSYGQDYGIQRLKYSFAHAESGSAEKKLAAVLRDFMIFIGDAPPKDDITIIVLKRNAKSEKKFNTLPSSSFEKEIDELEELEELEEPEQTKESEKNES